MNASPTRQGGVAALGLTMLLLFALLLGVAYVNRSLVFEQRASANQYRSTQAFEAAEAGLEWTLARLNDVRPIGADCLPSADPGATAFRERYLSWNAANATWSPILWNDGGVPTPLRPACVRADDGWQCSCPNDAAPVLAAPAGVAPAPAFAIQLQGGARAGLIRLAASGCSSLAAPCLGGADVADATAQVQVQAGLVPALRTAPAAALTARGRVDVDAAAFGAHNADTASGGIAIHAGGEVNAAHARLGGPPGASPASAMAPLDAALATQAPARFFASYFGLDKTHWGSQPVVRRIRCIDDCTADVLAAVQGGSAPPLLLADGDLHLRGPATLGSPERPVVIVADGAIRLEGAVDVHGVLYGRALTWTPIAGQSGLVRGALITEGDFAGGVPLDVVYDPAVLARLRGSAGTFARVNGSWRDF